MTNVVITANVVRECAVRRLVFKKTEEEEEVTFFNSFKLCSVDVFYGLFDNHHICIEYVSGWRLNGD